MPARKGESTCSQCQSEIRIPIRDTGEAFANEREVPLHTTVPIDRPGTEAPSILEQTISLPVLEGPPEMGAYFTGNNTLKAFQQDVTHGLGMQGSSIETVPSTMGSTAFFLSDLTLDLSMVAHMTPGLYQLADCPLRRLMRFFCGDSEESTISDSQIEEARELVEDLMKLADAKPVTSEQIDLFTRDPVTGNRGQFIIKHQSAALGGISFTYVTTPDRCSRYCWVQVLRHIFRDVTLTIPIVVRDFRRFNPVENDKSPSGYPDLVSDGPTYRQDQNDRQTEDGYVMDGHSRRGGRNPICQIPNSPLDRMNIYMDAPLFRDDGFSANEEDKKRPLLVLISQFETCVKCDNPSSNYFACFTWYFVKIRGDREYPNGRCYLEVPGNTQASNRPSNSFLQAVQNWQR